MTDNKYSHLLRAPEMIRQNEKDFLLKLYHSLNNMTMTTTMQQPSFSSGVTAHNWFLSMGDNTGAATEDDDEDDDDYCLYMGIICDEVTGLVKELDLSGLGLSGTLPLSFEPLTQLRRLNMRNNTIGGVLPTRLPATLIHWNLSQNRLHGPIMLQIDDNDNGDDDDDDDDNWVVLPSGLKRIVLSGNLLSGTIPQDLCKLTELRALHVSNNRFISGRLPECLGELPDLQALRIRNTNMIGPIPEILCPAVADDTNNHNNTTLGLCKPWEFCTEGYREVYAYQNSTVSTCEACQEPSNRIASPRCEVLAEPSTPYPTESFSALPSDAPSLIPSSLPTSLTPSTIFVHETSYPSSLHPSVQPTVLLQQSEDPSFFSPWPSPPPSKSPTSRPSARDTRPPESHAPSFLHTDLALPSSWPLVDHISSSPSGVPGLESSRPSSQPEAAGGTFNGAVGGSPQTGERSDVDTMREGAVTALAVTLLICCLGLAAVVFVAIRRNTQVWPSRGRRERHFRMLQNTQSGDEEACVEDADDDDDENEEPSMNSNHGASSIGANKRRPTTLPVRRPCIVSPGTISANPKVRFFLRARSESSSSEDGDEGEQSPDQQYNSSCAVVSTTSKTLERFTSVFRSSCDIYGKRKEEAEQTDFSSPLDSILSSNSEKSFADSSVSSTTPTLNALDEATRNHVLTGDLTKTGVSAPITVGDMPIYCTKTGESKTCDDIENRQACLPNLPLENQRHDDRKSYTDSAAIRREVEQRHNQNTVRHRAPSLLHGSLLPHGRSNVICSTGFPLLGILPPCAGNQAQDDEIVEFYDNKDASPSRRWLEVEEIHI